MFKKIKNIFRLAKLSNRTIKQAVMSTLAALDLNFEVGDNVFTLYFDIKEEELYMRIYAREETKDLVIMYFFKSVKSDNKQVEEIYADLIACKLELSKPLYNLLNKLRSSDLYSPDQGSQMQTRMKWIKYYY